MVQRDSAAWVFFMVLRKLNPEDCPLVHLLEKSIFEDAWSEASVRGLLSQPGSIAFGCYEEKELLGYFLGQQILDEAEVHRIAAVPEARRMGVGSLLMEEFLRICRENGAVSQTLEVRAGNVPALRLYEKFGFQTEGIRKNYYRNPSEDALIMWRRGEVGQAR